MRARLAFIPIAIVAAAGILAGVLWLTRGNPIEQIRANGIGYVARSGPAAAERMLELYTNTTIERGNRVDLLLDGQHTYPRLWADLRGATRTITLQSYYSLPSGVADTLATILGERAKAGVRVLVLLDAFGSKEMPRAWLDGMRRAGVHIAKLRALQWYTIHTAANRSHVRAIVVDGRVGYTGGFGLADYWLGDGRHAEQWRETNVRFEGPAVGQLQAAFGAAWAEATGELILGEEYFPATSVAAPPTVRAGLFYSSPTIGNTPAERFLDLLIASAKHRLYITNSYFVPNANMRALLEDAAARGVDVRILTAGPTTDVKTMWLAGRWRYEEMLACGIRIFEYRPTMLHAKTISVDGGWGAIGSTNFDSRSVAFNDEANLIVIDSAFVGRMDAAFADDLGYSNEITLMQFRRRSWWAKAQELGATLLSRLL